MPQVFKMGFCIPKVALRNIMRIFEARNTEVIEKWNAHYGKISFYC